MSHLGPHPLRITAPSASGTTGETRALGKMGFAPRLLVWAAREWSLDRGHVEGSVRLLRQAFTLAKCSAAVTPLDELLLIAVHGAARPVTFGAAHGAVSEDETSLLQVIGAFQDEPVVSGERALDAWLQPAAARLAVDPALHLARILGRSGLHARPRGRAH